MFENQHYDAIDETFSNTMNDDSWQEVNGVPVQAWINRNNDKPSLFMVCDCLEIKETFNNLVLRSEKKIVSGRGLALEGISLICETEVPRDLFVYLASNLISYEQDCEQKPVDFTNWCNEWKNTIGNTLVEPRVYDIISEMIVLDYLQKTGYAPHWAGPDGGRHDILCSGFDVEVKSTICWANDVSIESSVIQLDPDVMKLYLCVCVLERAYNGNFSIREIAEDLVNSGIDRDVIYKNLSKLGLDDTSSMERRFNVLNPIRIYLIDDEFPILRDSDFVGGKQPAFVHNLRYSLTISDVPDKEIDVRKKGSKIVFKPSSQERV